MDPKENESFIFESSQREECGIMRKSIRSESNRHDVMNSYVLFTVCLICLASLSGEADAFCAFSSEGLHADLTKAVVRSSDWLRKIYKDSTTQLRPYRAASVIATLRIAGHTPNTLLTEFNDSQGLNIDEILKKKLDSVKNLSTIPNPHLGLMIQGVISICKDPETFHGYNLIQPLLNGFSKFKKHPSFNNYFGYSLAVIALCNAHHKVPDSVIQELVNGANRVVSYHSVDIDALILIALSCVSTSNTTLQHEVDKASWKLVGNLMEAQNSSTGAFGNQYTTALAVEALQAARINTSSYCCDKAMRYLLTFQDEEGENEGSFGSILANIQVTPALLGESLISLKNYPCPPEPTPTPQPQIIAVRVQLVFNVTNLKRTEPAVAVNVLEGETAYNVLELAKLVNRCYTATYKKYSFGRWVQSICGVFSDWKKKQYWMIYINGKSAKYGVDGLKPNDGDIITFVYKKLSFR